MDSSLSFVLLILLVYCFSLVEVIPVSQQVGVGGKSGKMSINVKTQQTVIDALSMDCRNHRKTVLCHTPSGVRTDAELFISSQDCLAELFTGEVGSTIAVSPNISFVRRLCKQSLYQKFSVELVFAVSSYCDPCMLALDIMNKFRTELSFVSKAAYLTELPPGTFRNKQAFIAYLVTVTNEQVESFDLLWGCRSGESFETLLPKNIVEIPDIKELLREKGGPLSRKSTRKNSCVEVSSNGNSLPLTFTSDPKDRRNLREAFSYLISQLREFCEDFPASVIQVKSGIDWKAARRIERSVLFLQSFDDAQILDLAVHLTQCRIDFHFSTPRSVVLDLNGVSSATLVRLFQYAEIPIPTSTTQGAFSVSFIDPGEDGYSNAKADRELTKINVTWGRISALGSVPAQIKLSNLQKIERFHREENEIETWIWETLQGTCPQKVLCFDEENNTDWYMQFHIPTKSEKALPTKMTLDDEAILVEHARPYAYLQTGAIRPPAEETMHEHWKNAARLAPSERKDRSSFIAHVENNFASLQRISLLHEFPVIHQGVRYIGTCEASQFPILFINGEVTVDRCIRTLIENSGSFPELQDELQESYDSYIQDPPIPNDFRCQTPVAYILSVCSSDLTPINIGRIVKGSRGLFVSSTELLKCHAYTKCTVAILLPKGIKLELVCTPSRHIEILAKIPVASSPRQSQSIVTQPTALGVNDTNVAELSQALQSSLSLDTNTGLPQPNASVESPPKVSSEVHADEHEKRNTIEAKVPPAVSGGTGPIANTSSLCHELHSEKVITPTATWPPKQDPQSERAGCLSEEPACLTQEVKSREVDKKDDLPKEVQLESESPPALAREDEDLGRKDDPPFDGFLTISLSGDDLCLLGGKDLLFPLPTLCLLGVLGNCPTLFDLRALGISLSSCSKGVIRCVLPTL